MKYEEYSSKVVYKITSKDSIVNNTNPPVEIKRTIINNNDIPIRLIIDDIHHINWHETIKHEDGSIYRFMIDFFDVDIPRKNYFKIKPKDSINFTSIINFNIIRANDEDTNETNVQLKHKTPIEKKHYGVYYISFNYKVWNDAICKYKNCIKSLESNVVKVKFVNQ